ncbi:hypothetical protein PPYR_11294 [Photinus pyralis]|uniref:Uncharacterized protein n=1 Tax=Photinus pyralis TaxID=7054 RepID=A0A1Y1MUA8_PHOPY|nr:hypothetical protein PPYR_11294 [Photinus pyralis]
MSRNFFNNLFSSQKKAPVEEVEEVKPPIRRLSISKSGRMKQKYRPRLTLADSGPFHNEDSNASKEKGGDATTNKRDEEKASFSTFSSSESQESKTNSDKVAGEVF